MQIIEEITFSISWLLC